MTDQLAAGVGDIEADALIEQVSFILIFILVLLVGIFVGIR